jgi:hypothetical protein
VPFQKGVSGNPAGRRPGQMRAIQNLAVEARKYALASLRTIDEIRRKGESEAVRLAAANSLLDRGFGKPAQSIDLAGELSLTHQLNFFEGLGLDDQRKLRDALHTIEREETLMIEHQDHVPEGDEEPFFDAAEAGEGAEAS